VAVALYSAAATAGPTHLNVPVRRVVAPENLLENVRTIEIGNFVGPEGDTIAAEIHSALDDPNRTAAHTALLAREVAQASTQVASSVASRTVGGGIQGRIVKGITSNMSSGIQHGLDVSPIHIDDGLTIDVIEIVATGADALLTGTVVLEEETTDSSQKVAQKDKHGDLIKDDGGRTLYENIACRHRKVSLKVTWTLVRDDRTLVGRTIDKRNGDSRCGEEIDALMSTQTLVDGLVAGLGRRIVQTFAPSWRVQRLSMSRDRALKPDNQRVRDGRYFEALCGLNWFLTYDPDHVGGHLNLGVIAEAMGYYGLATEQYAAAAALRTNKGTERAQDRIAQRKEEVSKMVSAYGLTWKIGETPDLSTCPKTPEGRHGLLKKAATLRSESKGGEPMGMLAKGTTVFLLERGRDSARVALPDGRRGWIDAHRLK